MKRFISALTTALLLLLSTRFVFANQCGKAPASTDGKQAGICCYNQAWGQPTCDPGFMISGTFPCPSSALRIHYQIVAAGGGGGGGGGDRQQRPNLPKKHILAIS